MPTILNHTNCSNVTQALLAYQAFGNDEIHGDASKCKKTKKNAKEAGRSVHERASGAAAWMMRRSRMVKLGM